MRRTAVLHFFTRFIGSQETFYRVTQLCRSKTKAAAFIIILMFLFYSGFQFMNMPVELNICQTPPKTREFSSQNTDDNITIVTMYLNIGTFIKTSWFFFSKESYATEQYKNWLFSWGKLTNRVVAFFDDEDFIEQFRLKRAHLPESYTKIVKISKDQLSAFQHKKRVDEILQDPSFSVTYPPDYTCTMNAKYDVLEMAVNMADIKTKYIAWMDIGLFRKIQDNDPPFALKAPSNFNSSKLGFSEVSGRKQLSTLTPKDIYKQNTVWVAGGFVLGVKKVILDFIVAYRSAMKELLDKGYADTDQQVIASMYSTEMAWKQKVEIMTYNCPRGAFNLFGHAYLYFCLPYICRASAECKDKLPTNLDHVQSLHLTSNAKS